VGWLNPLLIHHGKGNRGEDGVFSGAQALRGREGRSGGLGWAKLSDRPPVGWLNREFDII